MAAIELNNLSKCFGSLTILDDLNLKIDKGEFVVLLGPSGCGKSTLLNIIAGLIEQTSGQTWIGGKDVTDLDPKDRNLAMVFQSYALYPTKTVRGNLKFGLTSRGYSNDEIERRIQSVASLLQIGPLLDRKPAQLSGGQRQRVAIGRALVKEVDVCLFDEPLSNLDAKLRMEMRVEIKKLHGRLKNTVVYVTHDQVEAMTMATRIAVMNKGVIEQIGTPDEIYENPQTLFVAEFVGSPSMNFIDLDIEEHDGRVIAKGAKSSLHFELTNNLGKSTLGHRRITAGIRPEHITVSETLSSEAALGSINLPMSHYEKLGAEALAFFETGDRLLTARVPPEKVAALKAKPKVSLSFVANQMSLFDPETGKRL